MRNPAARSSLTGQPPWSCQRATHYDIWQSADVQSILRTTKICEDRLRDLDRLENGAAPNENRRRRDHILRLIGLMHLALDEAVRHQRLLYMALHHAGVGPCSTSEPTLKEDPDRQ